MKSVLALVGLVAFLLAPASNVLAQRVSEEPAITILGQGALPNVSEQGASPDGLLGSIGVAYSDRYSQIIVSVSSAFTPAETSSPNSGDFGKSMLHPGNASQSLIVDVRGLRLYELLANRVAVFKESSTEKPAFWESALNALGVHGFLSFSQLSWQALPPLVASAQTVNGWNFSGNLGLSIDVLNTAYMGNNFLISIDLDLTTRALIGDLLSENQFRSSVLGTSDSAFCGFDGGLTLAVNGIVAKFSFIKMSGNIPGFSSGAINVYIGVQLGILRYVFPKPSEP